jgi:hypothetical protein
MRLCNILKVQCALVKSLYYIPEYIVCNVANSALTVIHHNQLQFSHNVHRYVKLTIHWTGACLIRIRGGLQLPTWNM